MGFIDFTMDIDKIYTCLKSKVIILKSDSISCFKQKYSYKNKFLFKNRSKKN